MADSIEVHSVDVLMELRDGILHFASEASDILAAIDGELRETFEWLDDREAYWQSIVEELRHALESAESDDDDDDFHQDDCANGSNALLSKLEDAEEELAAVRRARARVEEAAVDYRPRADAMIELVALQAQEAVYFLEHRYDELLNYARRRGPAASIPETTPSAPAAGLSPKPADRYLIAGGSLDVATLERALVAASRTGAGAFAVEAIRGRKTVVRFGQPIDDRTLGQFDPGANVITINERLRGHSVSVLAAHLAHEGMHVALSARHPLDRGSIDEEYQCRVAQHEVWMALKGGEKDGDCDANSRLVAAGERHAKEKLRSIPGYAELPEY